MSVLSMHELLKKGNCQKNGRPRNSCFANDCDWVGTYDVSALKYHELIDQ